MKPRPIRSSVSWSIKRFMNGVGQIYSATSTCEDDFWSWLAGFHEGEGNLNPNRSRWRPSARTYCSALLQIGQKNREVLDLIHSQTGVGYVRPTTEHYKDKTYTAYVWYVGKRRDVLWVLVNIYPHLKVEKKIVAPIIVELVDAYLHSPWHSWTKVEIDFLKTHYHYRLTDKKLAKLLDRTPKSIEGKRKELRLLKLRPWTPEDVTKLRKLYSVENSQLAKLLDRTEGAIRTKAYELRLRTLKEDSYP